MGRAGESIGISAGQGILGGALSGAAYGALGGNPYSVLVGAIVGGVLGATTGAIAYALAQGRPRDPSPNRDAVTTSSSREKPVALAFGRCRVGGVIIDVGGWWFRDDYAHHTAGAPQIRVCNWMLGLCEGPIQSFTDTGPVVTPSVGNFRLEGRPLELLHQSNELGMPCKVINFRVHLGTATDTLDPNLTDSTGSSVDYPGGNRFGYTDYSATASENTAIPWRNLAYIACTAYSGTVYEAPRIPSLNADIVGPDYTIRRNGTASDGPNPSDVCGYAFYDSYSDNFYATLTSSGVTAAPYGLISYGRQGAARTHQQPPSAVSSSIVRGWYLGRNDILVMNDPSDCGLFHVGYLGISPSSSDWQHQRPSSDYNTYPMLAFHLDELHSMLHSIHDNGAVRYILRWNLLTGRVDRLDTDCPSGSYKALQYSADIAHYIVAHDAANLRLIDPATGQTETLVTGISTATAVGVCVSGQQVGVISPNRLDYVDIYTGAISGPYGGSSTGIVVGALGGITSAHQSSFSGKVTTVGTYTGNPIFSQWAPSCVEDIRDLNASGTSGLSGLPNTNPRLSHYGAPEPNFQAGQIIGSQAFPAAHNIGQDNPVCKSTAIAAGVMSNVTDAFRDWSWRIFAVSPATAWSLKLLEGNSSLAAAAWAVCVNEPSLDTARYGAGFDSSYFSLGSFEGLHSWCVGAMRFQNSADAGGDNNPNPTSASRLAERYKFDFLLDSEMSLPSFLGQHILMSAGAYSYTIGGVFHLGVPKPGLLPVLSLDDGKFAEGSFGCVYSANVDGINRVRVVYRDVLDESRRNFAEAQDEQSINTLGRVQLATLNIDGCGRDQSAALLAKSVLDNSNAGRRQASFRIDYLGYVLAPTDGIEISNRQCGLNKVPMRLSSIKQSDSGSNEHIELACIEYKRTLDALDNQTNQTVQPGQGVGSGGNDIECSVAYGPYVSGENPNAQFMFNNGAALAPGQYTVTYQNGAFTKTVAGTHYFCHGYNVVGRVQSTGNVILLCAAPAVADPTSVFPDSRPGWYTEQDAETNNDGQTASFTLNSPASVFLQASGSLTPHVAINSPPAAWQLCHVTDASAPDPNSIAGIVGWWKADAVVYHDNAVTLATNGQTVQYWGDVSVNSNNLTQATLANRPTYLTNIINGYPVLAFNAGSSQVIANSHNYAAPFTAFVVARTIGGTNKRVFAGTSNNWLLGWWSGGRQQAFFNGAVKLDGVPAADLVWRAYSGSYDNATALLYENGVQLASVAGAFAGPNGVSLGGTTFNNEDSDCEVAEVIIYNTALSPTDRATVEAYLSAKYNLGF